MTGLPPIRREIVVAAEQERSFLTFTERIGAWWPIDDHSVYGKGSSVAFRDGCIVETHEGETDALWGRILVWDVPTALSFTWHPGVAPDRASRVDVSFEPLTSGRTLVRLVHSGWEVFADPAAARTEYDRGWFQVLEAFRGRVLTTHSTWAALLYRPAAGVADVFGDPRFAGHAAFLGSLQADGMLVGAGPLDDEPGAGMTIVRWPTPGAFEDIRRRVTEDDASVTSGLFTVSIRPWSVRAAT